MSEHSLSATLKAGTDFDSPWVVVYGNTPDEVEFKLRNLSGVLEATVQAAAELRALHQVGPGAGGQVVEVQQAAPQAPAQPQGWNTSPAEQAPSWAAGQQQAPPQQQAPAGVRLHPEGVQCPADGNVVQFKQITSKKTGKSYQMWTCPNQRSKDDGHYSEFVN